MYGMYYDSTYILIIIGVVITLIASARVKSTFAKYDKIRSGRGMTGKEVAEQILRTRGLSNVRVRHVAGHLSDHYDPRSNTVNLSDATYNSTSVAALGVAAHECGHAIQHAEQYAPLGMRTAILPIANFGSMAAWPLIFIGLFLTGNTSVILLQIGIIAFSASVLFQIVTLPVEFNASSRAVKLLDETGILSHDEIPAVKSVLGAAAMTYVASAAASILQLLRIVMLANRRND